MAAANPAPRTPSRASVSQHPDDGDQTLPSSSNTSPALSPPRPVINRVATPLGLFPGSHCRPFPASSATTGDSKESSLDTMSPAQTPEPDAATTPPRMGHDQVDAISKSGIDACQSSRYMPRGRPPYQGAAATMLTAGPTVARATTHGYEAPAAPSADPVARMTNTISPPDSNADGRNSPFPDIRPLRTASVRADTRLAQPKPIACSAQPGPDLKMRPGSPIGNIAQLEATAERLSMTSSIDDAIRDLHGELKRSDSRRSSILAASLRMSAADPAHHDDSVHPPVPEQFSTRHLSTTSSIVSTNTAARHGGYSPAAFVMSPTQSLSGRLRSGSKGATGRPDGEFESLLSRHGPGKSSERSVRSTKMLLAEISESEPVALTQAAFDEADAAPPIEELIDETILDLPHHHDEDAPALDDHDELPSKDAGDDIPLPLRIRNPTKVESNERESKPSSEQPTQEEERCTSSHSNNTFEQCRDAFVDFDGVHWEPEPELELTELDIFMPEMETDLATPRALADGLIMPQSHVDPRTGEPMMYYPARVPAMLNVPPKLSNKPKAAQRNQRRSQVLSAMMETNGQIALPGTPWSPPPPDPRTPIPGTDTRQSWLPDPLTGQRDSFVMLSPDSPAKSQKASSSNGNEDAVADAQAALQGTPAAPPQRQSALMDFDKRKSRASALMKLPPQLRASAFFDLPSATADVEIKDGSAMATLDSILDASATAPVSAFTDHTLSVPDINAKKKKHKSRKSTATLGGAMSPGSQSAGAMASSALSPEPTEPRPKKRASFMWLGKRSNSDNDEKSRSRSMASAPLQSAHGEAGEVEGRTSADDNGEETPLNGQAAEEQSEVSDESEEEAYHGPPTTLLAELQLRKHEQQLRKKNMGSGFPNGIHATLLEMDTVAETQRKHRQSKRVNLAWEDPGMHLDQNGSDDEDVPLAILAAMQQGAKNRADLERPMGLMERREIEDNEPLSRRRARLQGLETLAPVTLRQRHSIMSFPVLGAAQDRSPRSAIGPTPGHGQDDDEGETLGERRRRLAAAEGGDGPLTTARPVSATFSAELLSQFGDVENTQNKSTGSKDRQPEETNGEETLGQRRRRLQAEKEARDREMSHGNLSVGAAPRISRKLSMADVLAAHPKNDVDVRTRQDEARRADEERLAMERDAKMAAMRRQMPQTLNQPQVDRSGGFRGGAYNDGSGGLGPLASRASVVLNSQPVGHAPYGAQNRSSVLLGNYGGQAHHPVYGAMGNYGSTNHLNNSGFLNGNAPMYGGGMMPMAMSGGSIDRVEQWRHGVHP
ncbi:hypothetical protein HIM_03594 [Hirsutella minnesotensis 3608]|uniref:Uncharacterized protein n=1 Tax=Hirsutella minnesotensis 3608 TaxID=1043627 RepID=A0A0F7ZVV5_9HYPO|nr:hypothetical protein HIM_03594 [Hirsutella minnesotensis 3608]